MIKFSYFESSFMSSMILTELLTMIFSLRLDQKWSLSHKTDTSVSSIPLMIFIPKFAIPSSFVKDVVLSWSSSIWETNELLCSRVKTYEPSAPKTLTGRLDSSKFVVSVQLTSLLLKGEFEAELSFIWKRNSSPTLTLDGGWVRK